MHVTSQFDGSFACKYPVSVDLVRSDEYTDHCPPAFLSGDMTYSCAIFPELDADLKGSSFPGAGSNCTSPGFSGSSQSSSEYSVASGIKISPENTRISEAPTTYKEDDSELCEAQIRKMLHIVKRADIRQGHRVRLLQQARAGRTTEAKVHRS